MTGHLFVWNVQFSVYKTCIMAIEEFNVEYMDGNSLWPHS